MENEVYIKDCLSELCTKMKVICKNVYPIYRPASIDKQMNEFVVVKLVFSVKDNSAYQNMTYRIEVYAREKENGIANVAKLDNLINKVMKVFPYQTSDRRFDFGKPYVRIGGSDQLGFTIHSLTGKMIVNTTNKFN